MIFRIYHTRRGGHIHMRFFAGEKEGQLGKCGDLVMQLHEFEVFRIDSPNIEFTEEVGL